MTAAIGRPTADPSSDRGSREHVERRTGSGGGVDFPAGHDGGTADGDRYAGAQIGKPRNPGLTFEESPGCGKQVLLDLVGITGSQQNNRRLIVQLWIRRPEKSSRHTSPAIDPANRLHDSKQQPQALLLCIVTGVYPLVAPTAHGPGIADAYSCSSEAGSDDLKQPTSLLRQRKLGRRPIRLLPAFLGSQAMKRRSICDQSLSLT